VKELTSPQPPLSHNQSSLSSPLPPLPPFTPISQQRSPIITERQASEPVLNPPEITNNVKEDKKDKKWTDTLQTAQFFGGTRSLSKRKSQIASPTQTQFSGLTSSAPPSNVFHLSGEGSTISSSVGRRVSLFSVEIIASSRMQLTPDPVEDQLLGIVWHLYDTFGHDSESEVTHKLSGAILCSNQGGTSTFGWATSVGKDVEVIEMENERDVFLVFENVMDRYDPVVFNFRQAPFCLFLVSFKVCFFRTFSNSLSIAYNHVYKQDILCGWDIERTSLKWLLRRARQLDPPIDMSRRLSRVPNEPQNDKNDNDEWGLTTQSDVHLTGRVVLTLWRIMREELKLCSYTLENVVKTVLKRRIPHVFFDANTYILIIMFLSRCKVFASLSLKFSLMRICLVLLLIKRWHHMYCMGGGIPV
jgi:hypothetical protein